MADKQSREGKYLVLKCIKCMKEKTTLASVSDGLSCEECGGYLIPSRYTHVPPTPKREGSISKDLINPEGVNISEVIKGLKAIQREARQTTKALKELEKQQSKIPGIISIEKENKIMKRCRQCGGKEFEHQTMQNLEGTIINTTTICTKCGDSI